MRDPAGDRERMERQRRNRKFIFIFGSIVLIALLISILGAIWGVRMKQRHEPGPPMTLGNMATLGVQHLLAFP